MATEDDVRRIALSLPETVEKPWFGTTGYKVKDRGFLRIRSEAEGGLVVYVADLGERKPFSRRSRSSFSPLRITTATAVLVDLAAIDVDELREMITESWRLRAPARVLKGYDQNAG